MGGVGDTKGRHGVGGAGGRVFGCVCEREAGFLTPPLQIFSGVVESRMPNTVCTALFIEPRETQNGGWYGNYTVGPRLKKTSECVCVCLCTYRESRQRDLAVHPHVSLHLSLELLLGAQFIWRNAISEGGEGEGGHNKGQLPNQIHR